MKQKTYDTPEDKAKRVLACCGRAPVELAGLSKGDVAKVAALLGNDGQLVDDGQAKFRDLMLELNDKRKAVNADDEPAVDVAAQQKVRDEAAALVAQAKEPATQPAPESKEGE